MNITARFGAIMAIVFSAICFGFAFSGFSSLGEVTDPVQAADSQGYAWFWAFLGGVGVAMGILSWWIARDPHGDQDG